MVNYCCVQGCGRNSKQNKHLNYYSLPKERRRQIQWLQAAGRTELLEKDKVLVSHRICSRHFPPSAIKNKHLCDTAMPTLCLPGTSGDVVEVHQHKGIVCNNCGLQVCGFRYKCVSCADYDLCQQCETRETHAEHYMLRMPKPLKYKLADDLISKWRAFFSAKHATPESDSDDEPITKYRNSNSELSEEVKRAIRAEVARVSELPAPGNPLLLSKKRMGEEIQRSIKRIRMDGTIGYDDEETPAPEVAFADVNEENQLLEVKSETDDWKSMVHVKLSDDLTELMIEVPRPGRSDVTAL